MGSSSVNPTSGAADQTRVFDGRSSDGIALAIHFRALIFVEEALLENVSKGNRDSSIVL